MKRYVKNGGLFAGSYFERVLAERRTPVERQLPSDAAERFALPRELWEDARGRFMRDTRAQRVTLLCQYERVLGYAVAQNRTMRLSDAVAEEVRRTPLEGEALGPRFRRRLRGGTPTSLAESSHCNLPSRLRRG